MTKALPTLARPFIATAIVLAAVIVLEISAPARPAYALTNCTVDQSQVNRDSEEAAFLGLINAFRANPSAYGYPGYPAAPALAHATGLDRASAWHVVDMSAKKYFSHTEPAPSNRTFDRRITNCDYTWTAAGENIAVGTASSSAQQAFTMWLNSSGHRDNMMSRNFTEIGIARYNGPCHNPNWGGSCWFWNTTFGKPSGSGGGTPPAQDVLEFGSASYSGSESSGGITATIIRNGAATGTVSVRCRPSSTNATATAGSDYTSGDVTVTLGPGEMSKTCRIPVIDDSEDEPNETIRVSLTNPSTGAVVGSQSTTTLTIIDNDEPPVFVPTDANCDGSINATDALLAMRLIAGSATQPRGCGPFDADGDGFLTLADVMLLRRLIAGMP